jgi:hypothetical protein
VTDKAIQKRPESYVAECEWTALAGN